MALGKTGLGKHIGLGKGFRLIITAKLRLISVVDRGRHEYKKWY